MKSKNYLIIALALTTLGGASLAWRQYQELVELRAAALDTTERSDLQKKIADLEKANKELRDELASARGERDDNTEMAADGSESGNGAPAQSGGRGQNRRAQFAQVGAALRELMAKPEVQAMMSREQKAMLDNQYAALFQKLNLSPEQADKLKDLLLQRQQAQRDVNQVARDQGINPRTDPQGFQKLVADSQAPINDSIKSLLGDSGYDQFTNYEQTIPQRNIVNLLQQKLSYTDSPLNSSQADQLVQVLAANTPQKPTGTTEPTWGGGGFGRVAEMVGGGFGGGGPAGGGGTAAALVGRNAAPITSEAVNQAQAVLTPTQVSALQQLQQQQQTAQQLQQMIRATAQQAAQQAGGTAAPAGGGRKGGGG